MRECVNAELQVAHLQGYTFYMECILCVNAASAGGKLKGGGLL